MARFSERTGVKPPKTVLQLDSMDDDLRNGLWNAFWISLVPRMTNKSDYFRDLDSYGETFFKRLWLWHFNEPLDQMPRALEQRIMTLRTRFYDWNLAAVYDFIDFAARAFPERDGCDYFVKNC